MRRRIGASSLPSSSVRARTAGPDPGGHRSVADPDNCPRRYRSLPAMKQAIGNTNLIRLKRILDVSLAAPVGCLEECCNWK